MGYLRCFGSPNAELGSLLRCAVFSFAMFEDLLESGRGDGLHVRAGADRVTALSALATVFLSAVLCHLLLRGGRNGHRALNGPHDYNLAASEKSVGDSRGIMAGIDDHPHESAPPFPAPQAGAHCVA